MANSDFSFWIGMFVPSKTPREVVEKLYQETRKAAESEAAHDKFRTLGGEPMAMSPAEFDALIRREQDANAELVKAAGIKPN